MADDGDLWPQPGHAQADSQDRPTASRRPADTRAAATNERPHTAADYLPSVSLLKGGGAIRGIGETFRANPLTGEFPNTSTRGIEGEDPDVFVLSAAEDRRAIFALRLRRANDRGESLVERPQAGDADSFTGLATAPTAKPLGWPYLSEGALHGFPTEAFAGVSFSSCDRTR